MKDHRVYTLVILAIFLNLFMLNTFQHGLFFDGLIYSSISNNLANGVGSFWHPHFSETIYPAFYEHPPLVFGIEAILMSFFDGAFFAEKVFGLILASLTILLIGVIWRVVFQNSQLKQLWWFPILLWMLTPKNAWAFSNNILENTMTVFSLFSVYLILKSFFLHKGIKKGLLLFSAGFVLGLAFLSKGFPGLFPLGFIACYWLIKREKMDFKSTIIQSLIVFCGLGVFLVVLFLSSADALHNLHTYIDTQVLASIQGDSRVGSRWVVLKNLFNELIPMLLIGVFTFVGFRKKLKANFNKENEVILWALLFLIVGFTASLPLMVSLKISSFYLIPALPYFNLGIAMILARFWLEISNILMSNKWLKSIIFGVSIGGILFSISWSVFKFDTVARDFECFHDLKATKEIFEVNKVVSLGKDFHQDWTTIAYLQRYFQVSLDRSKKQRKIHMQPAGANFAESNYECIYKGKKFDLYILKTSAQLVF